MTQQPVTQRMILWALDLYIALLCVLAVALPLGITAFVIWWLV